MLRSINPYTQELLEEFQPLQDGELEQILQTHEAMFASYKLRSFEWRAERMHKAADVLLTNREKYARTITLEMGKLYQESLAEIEKCAWVCRYYADHAASFLADRTVATDASKSFICFRPIGTILAVMPWNFPFWQVFRFAAPTLMAGNTGLLKHASNVSRCALMIQEVFAEAGFDEGSFSTLLLESERVTGVIADDRIKAVTLTGSGTAGRAVAGAAGAHLKKTVLELGGSDPYLVLSDADIEKAAQICAKARMLNAGQSCIGAKRFIVDASVFDDFLELFQAIISDYHLGNPFEKETTLAPLASPDFRDDLHRQVTESLASGYRLVVGGFKPNHLSDSFYPGTIIVGDQENAPAYQEELFGPVATVIKAKNEREACRIANDTPFGLGAAIFSQDHGRALTLAKDHIEAGCCFINAQVKSDPRLPFGGIKESGFGRELSMHGIQEFMNIKTIYQA